MTNEYDVIIAGLGAMGSAAAYHLAKAGRHVLGLDRFQPPHHFGSSQGLTRIIREAYFEHPLYVPLVHRAYELWNELEQESSRQLLLQTGGLMIGPPNGILVRGAQRSAEEHHLSHRVLSAAVVRREFPAFHLDSDMIAVWEPRAGILDPELAVQTHLELAAKWGADLRFNTCVLGWEPRNGGVLVRTATEAYVAGQLLLSAGAWINSLIPDLNLPLTVERQVLFWFDPRSQPDLFQPQRCPIFICEHAPHRFFYGFPDLGDGVKIGVHHEGAETSPDRLEREVKEHETETARTMLRRLLPDAAGPLRSASACMYTNTPDEHFLFDWHPAFPQVLIASPCSGHGFKFSPVIGELTATLLGGGAPPFDLSLFKLARFASNSQ
jgi:sarcosine oxidase